jgi:hypothetical protein
MAKDLRALHTLGHTPYIPAPYLVEAGAENGRFLAEMGPFCAKNRKKMQQNEAGFEAFLLIPE